MSDDKTPENRTPEEQADSVYDAIAGWVRRELKPLLVRLNSLAHRADVVEARVVALAERKSSGTGPPGPRGPAGPRPDHSWRGTELRFQRADESWGEYTDLEGPPGPAGNLTAAGLPVVFGGGGGSAAPVNSWFPAGW